MESNANAVLVDSSVWIAYFDKDDSHYQQAKNLVDSAGTATLLCTDYTIQEVITIFLYRNQKKLIRELLKTLKRPEIETITVENYFLSTLVEFIEEQGYRPKISLTDWSLLLLADEFSFKLLTFDKQLNNTYNKVVA